MARDRKRQQDTDLQERVVYINRVSKTVKGGRRMSPSRPRCRRRRQGPRWSSAWASPLRCPLAIQKGVEDAKKNMFHVAGDRARAPFLTRSMGHFGAGRVLIKPAVPGTGVIAGGPVRAALRACRHHERPVQVAWARTTLINSHQGRCRGPQGSLHAPPRPLSAVA